MNNSELKSKKILVLMGGWNEEREVSLKSGEAVLNALLSAGYNAVGLDFDRSFIDKISKIAPDIVFIALHGKFGEDGRVQSILDFLQIPYTHSSSLPCSICMNKEITLSLVKHLINVPRGHILHKGDVDKNKEKIADIGYPIVIKPLDSGSSVGVNIILQPNDFDIDQYDWPYGDRMIAEEYIKGKEVQVAVMNNSAIGAIEIRPKNKFYDYESKYSGGSEYIMPADIPEEIYSELLKSCKAVHEYLNCSGVSRVDCIYSPEKRKFYFLEINTHPGFTENSLLPKIAKYQGISFLQIVEYLLNTAKCDL